MTAIYSGEQLKLNGPLATKLLIVHLGDPPAVIERNGHALQYEKLETEGSGTFEIRNHGQLEHRIESRRR